jgi:hypothetical protein
MTRDAAGNFAKTGGAAATWDSQVYSDVGYTRCTVVCKARDTSLASMLGLNSDPTTNASYTSIDYALYLSAGTLLLYESGSAVATIGSYTTDDVLAIVYDGATIRYYQNQTLLRTAAVGSPNTKLFLDSSCFDVGAGFREVQFGPILTVGTFQLDPNATAKTDIATASSFTITKQQHSPDGQSFNDSILSVTVTPADNCDLIVSVSCWVQYAMAAAHTFADFQYSIQQDSAYVDEQHWFQPAPGATDSYGINLSYEKKFAGVKGVATTLKFMGAQFNSDDVLTVQNAQLRVIQQLR